MGERLDLLGENCDIVSMSIFDNSKESIIHGIGSIADLSGSLYRETDGILADLPADMLFRLDYLNYSQDMRKAFDEFKRSS